MPFSSPFGNGPQSIPSAIPNGMTTAQLAGAAAIPASAQAPKIASPPPQDAPAPQGQVPQGGGDPLSKIPNPSSDPLSKVPNSPQSYPYPSPTADDPYPVGDDGFHYRSQSIRRNADGEYEMKPVHGKDEGKWRPLSKTEKDIFTELGNALGATQHGLGSMVGSMIGGAAGKMTGVPGLEIVLSGLGSVAGGKIADMVGPLADVKDVPLRNKLIQGLVDFASGASGPMISGYLEKKGAQAASAAIGAETEPAVQAAATKLGQQADGMGVQLRADQQNPENLRLSNQVQDAVENGSRQTQQNFTAQQLSQNQQMVDAINKLPGIPEAKKAGNYSFRDYLDQLRDAHAEGIKKISQSVREFAGGIKDDPDRVAAKMQGEAEALGVQFHKDGSVADQTLMNKDAAPLVREIIQLRNLTRRETSAEGFGMVGGQVPEPTPYQAPGSLEPGVYEASQPTASRMQGQPRQVSGAGGDIEMSPSFNNPDPSRGSYNQKYPSISAPENAIGNLPPNPAGDGKTGITYSQLESLIDRVEKNANFKGKQDPTPVERAWQRIYGEASDFRDDFAQKILGDNRVNRPDLANELRFSRDQFNQQIEPIKQIRKIIAENPTQAGKYLLDPSKPELAAKVIQIAAPSDKAILKGQYLDNLISPNVIKPTETSGSAFVSGSSILKKWEEAKKEPGFMSQIFDKDEIGVVDKFINVARAVESRQVAIKDIANNPMVKNIEGMLLNPDRKYWFMRNAYYTLRGIFQNHPEIADYLQKRVYARYPLTAAQYQERAQTFNKAGGFMRTMSPAIPAGAQLGAVPMMQQQMQQSQQPEQ